MTHRLCKIVSGGGIGSELGATGCELGAIIAAKELGLEIGGCLCDMNTSPILGNSRPSRAIQRRLNVQNSDATLFVLRHDSEPNKFIVDACKAQRKPAKQILLHEGIGASVVIEELRQWIIDRNISVLNIVGDTSEQDTYRLIYDLVDWPYVHGDV